jgi:hypothetical protein
MQLAYSGLCSYRDGNGRLCRCDLQVYRDGDVAVVVATEREDNPGSSITNSYAYLATGVWQKLKLSFKPVPYGQPVRLSQWGLAHAVAHSPLV